MNEREIAKQLVRLAKGITADMEVGPAELPSQKELSTEQKINKFFKSRQNYDVPYKAMMYGKFQMSPDELKQLQNEIIKRKDVWNAYGFALFIKGADIKKLQNVILRDEETGGLVPMFARDVKGADVKKLQDKVIDNGVAQWIYEFAKNVKGADIGKLYEAIKKCKGPLVEDEVAKFERKILKKPRLAKGVTADDRIADFDIKNYQKDYQKAYDATIEKMKNFGFGGTKAYRHHFDDVLIALDDLTPDVVKKMVAKANKEGDQQKAENYGDGASGALLHLFGLWLAKTFNREG